MGDYVSSIDLEDWWGDLTIEQRRAAFELWQKSEIKSIFVEVDNTTHSQVTTHLFEQSDKEKEHAEIRKQLASKVVWDQDRFPRPMAWDEDRFKGVNNDG